MSTRDNPGSGREKPAEEHEAPGALRAAELERRNRVVANGKGHPAKSSALGRRHSISLSRSSPTPFTVLTGPGNPGDFHRDRSAAPHPLYQDVDPVPAGFPLGSQFPADPSRISFPPPRPPQGHTTPVPNIPTVAGGGRVLVASTPDSEDAPTQSTAPYQVKDEPDEHMAGGLDTFPPYIPVYPRLSAEPSPRTSEPGSQPVDQFVGNLEYTTFDDIRPPTWGELQDGGGSAITQKFMADMYKFMYIANNTSIRNEKNFELFTVADEKLEHTLQLSCDEAADARREVQRLSSEMVALQNKVSTMLAEIKLLTRPNHESSPPRPPLPRPGPSTSTSSEVARAPNPAPRADLKGKAKEVLGSTLPSNNDPDYDDVPGWSTSSQIGAADAALLDARTYAPVQSDTAGWNKVARKGAVKNAKGTVEMKNNAPANPSPLRRPRVIDDSQLWILRFNGNAPARRMTPAQMHTAVNVLDKGIWAFDVVTANWSQGGNGNCIMLRFTAQTTEKAIDIHHAKILARLSHGVDGATLTRNVQWSKVVVMNVPCRKGRLAPSGEDEDHVDEVMHENEEIEEYWSPADLDAQMRVNPLYRGLHVTQKPNWMTSPDAMEGRTHANVSFSFEDPNMEFTGELFTRPMYLFNERCPMRVWKERVHVSQCERCWKLGPSHADCTQRCRRCARTGHLEFEHQARCAHCEKGGWAADGKECIHFTCANCNATHAADDGNCRARSEYVRIQRNRNNARYQKPSNAVGSAHGRR